MTTKVRSKYSVCTICDIGCQLRAIEKDGYVNRILAHDNPLLSKNICYKSVFYTPLTWPTPSDDEDLGLCCSLAIGTAG